MRISSTAAAGRTLIAGAMLLGGAASPGLLRGDLYGARSQRVQDSVGSGLEGLAFNDDNFGLAQAAGDFDGNGLDDLAIGDYESLTGDREGAVHVLYSDASGVSSANDVLFKDFDPATGQSDREIGDEFGAALAAGDFNGDGFDDLAIGIPREDIGFVVNAGTVLVIYGSTEGLTTANAPLPQKWRIGAGGIFSTPKSGDLFGLALATGDFDQDGRDDLAIGCPSCDAFTFQLPEDSGSVWILYGSATGITASGLRHLDQDSSDAGGILMLNSCEVSDFFGQSLAAGDFNGDLSDDLAIGVASETLGTANNAGAVQVVYGSPGAGLHVAGNQFWRESNVATGGVEEADDHFGLVLAAGDVTGDGIDDLVIGTPYEDVAGFGDAGAVTLLWGQPGTGLDTPGSEIYDQSSLGDGEAPGQFEYFGFALAIGDFVDQNALGARDLAIGIPQESVQDPESGETLLFAGGVTIVPGGFGLDAPSARLWAQGFHGSAGAADLEQSQAYGSTLASGDFDGDGHDDLAVGALYVDGTNAGGPSLNSGAVYVLYGALFADGFESGDRGAWTSSVP
jgi:hypothetical protein